MLTQGVNVIDDGQAISINWNDGECSRYHAIWLRDNTLDPDSRNEQNGQRLVSVLDLPGDLGIESATIDDDGELSLRFAPDHKQSKFPLHWLKHHAYDTVRQNESAWTFPEIETWDHRLSADIPGADWSEACNDQQTLAGWLGAVHRYGFAKMTGLPCESGTLCRVAELFGFVRETNYGRWFEVQTKVNPVNLAYTGMGLQAHSDNPYREPVPTLQLLSCLENSADGGDSIVVDGFKAVQILAEESPEGLRLLSQNCARFEFSGSEGTSLKSRRPMIELAPDGELIGVRFNNRSTAPIVDVAYDDLPAYYAAYRRFAEIITHTDLEVSFKLKPGELFIVDNTRVLHSRKAYSGTGHRWLQGCYADKDGLLSKLRTIESNSPVPKT